MIVTLLSLLLAGLQPNSGDPIPEGFKFNGGPYDGLTTGYVVNGKGERLLGFAPSQSENVSIPLPIREAVSSLIKSYEMGDASVYKNYVTSDVESYVGCNYTCGPSKAFVKFPFGDGKNIHANPILHLSKGEYGPVVRIEWLHDSGVWYLSYIYFRSDKIYRVSSAVANVPSVHIEGR